MDDLAVRIERTYDAPIEDVFDAWTSAEVVSRWWRAEHHFTVSEAVVEPRLGGEIRVVMSDSEKDAEYGGGGQYTEFDRPNRLAFTWTWDRDDRRTLIRIDFREVPGGTAVSFIHSRLLDMATVRDHEHGWSNILTALGDHLRDAQSQV